MKTSLLTVAILLATSLMAGNGPQNSYARHDGYNNPLPSHTTHKKRKHRYVKVISSRPLYKEVITYRDCHSHLDGRKGALIGGVVGGLIGNQISTGHKAAHTVGGAVAGAVIGSVFVERHQRPKRHCKRVERELIGYKNIAYWHGQKIVRISDRPLKRIRIDTPSGMRIDDALQRQSQCPADLFYNSKC